MTARKEIIFLVLHSMLVVLLFFQLTMWQDPIIGRLALIAYLCMLSRVWQGILVSIFGFPRRDWRVWILGAVGSVLFLGFIGGICVAWYRVTPLSLTAVYALTSGISFLLFFLRRLHPSESEHDESVHSVFERIRLLKKRPIFFVIFFLLFLTAGWLLRSSADGALVSPWQQISPIFLVLVFALALFTGCFIFSDFSAKTIVLCITAVSLLMHLYLPLSHVLPWGGDIWRLVATEERIAQGEFIRPVLFGPEVSWSERWGVPMPDVFFSPQKYAYAQFWSLHVLASQTAGISLLTLSRFFLPVFWSISIPIIFFFFGARVFRSKKMGLLFSWLSLLPFSLQAMGGLALPAALGYIGFFFILLLFLRSRESRHPLSRVVVFLFSILMLFGYPLHTIILWSVMILSGLQSSVFSLRSHSWRVFFTICLSGLALVCLPVIELISGISKFPSQWNAVEFLKQLGGQLSGWYYASAIRPHDIPSGNIFFNHTPENAFVSTVFTDWRWFVVPAMVFILGGACLGLFSLVKKRAWDRWVPFIVIFLMTVGGYTIGWFVLEGERLLVRRLDGMMAFIILLFFLQGVAFVSSRVTAFADRRLAHGIVIACIAFFSWFAMTAYASGPDMRVVSMDEYSAAQYIWGQTKAEQKEIRNWKLETGNSFCVLGDTWILLALEGISSGHIIGGGFPIDASFGQADRVRLFSAIGERSVKDILDESYRLTGAKECWIALPRERATAAIRESLEAGGAESEYFSSTTFVWRLPPSS